MARPLRVIPVDFIEYDQETSKLTFYPSHLPPSTPKIVRLDDGTEYPVTEESGGGFSTTIPGWSKYCMASS
jgi:hypothetical protein